LGITPLDDFDEAYYAEGAREMLERGDLGTPYYNGRPFLLKPILIYWLIAAAFRIFGPTEFAARSVSAFFATAIVLLTYCFAARTIGRRAGLPPPDPRTALTHEALVPIVREEVPSTSVWMRRGAYVLVTNHSVHHIWAPDGGRHPSRHSPLTPTPRTPTPLAPASAPPKA
ncbi:MAG: glycosyltransferase family 39 protein, partial [Armatimonadetes bacterium]|nr:glycosyltransferase family 39 protein [Armatimonadota bacterium]